MKDWPTTYTADGVLITPGLWVFTNNMREAQVTGYLHAETNQNTGHVAHWFDTTDAMMDESRMSTMLHGRKAGPFTRDLPPMVPSDDPRLAEVKHVADLVWLRSRYEGIPDAQRVHLVIRAVLHTLDQED